MIKAEKLVHRVQIGSLSRKSDYVGMIFPANAPNNSDADQKLTFMCNISLNQGVFIVVSYNKSWR